LHFHANGKAKTMPISKTKKKDENPCIFYHYGYLCNFPGLTGGSIRKKIFPISKKFLPPPGCLILYVFFYTMPLMKRMKLFAVNIRLITKPDSKLKAEV
jgi:hypothetical protein